MRLFKHSGSRVSAIYSIRTGSEYSHVLWFIKDFAVYDIYLYSNRTKLPACCHMKNDRVSCYFSAEEKDSMITIY